METTSSVKVMTAGGVGRSIHRKKKKTPKKETVGTATVAAVEAEAAASRKQHQNSNAFDQLDHESPPSVDVMTLQHNSLNDGTAVHGDSLTTSAASLSTSISKKSDLEPDDLYKNPSLETKSSVAEEAAKASKTELFWLLLCFLGIMFSFVAYGLLLEYTTSGGRKLHELSFLFVTSSLYTVTAAAGRYVRNETPTTIPPARFAILGLTSMGSTFCSVRSLRYVIYPIQVLAKSCKPVPVMIMGAFMGKKYPLKKYINVVMIVGGVALFMGGGDSSHKGDDDVGGASSQMFGILLLFVSLCFDGGTGAYEDKLMSVHSVGPFDLMYNIQLGKTILAGVSLLVLNQVHVFLQMCQDMGFLLVALGLSGALGQVFIFVTISKFGALTCSIIGLARKVTTLVASIYFYGHSLNGIQFTGLVVSVSAMVLNFFGKKGGGGGHHGPPPPPAVDDEEMEKMLPNEPYKDHPGDVELGPLAESGKENKHNASLVA